MSDLESSIWLPYQGQGVVVYGLHPASESPQLVADFVEQTGVTYPIVPDIGGTRSGFSYPPGAGYPYPRDVVIGKDLTVHSIKNSFNVDEMDALVQQVLNE